MTKQKIKLLCDECKKNFFVCPCLKNRKFCSLKCSHKYLINNKIGIFSPVNLKEQQLNQIGFFNHKVHSLGGKECKRQKMGIFALSFKQRQVNSILANNIQKIKKTGFYNSDLQRELGRRGIEILRKKKIGYFSFDIRSKGGKKGSITLRNKKRILFNNINFDSYRECEIGMCIHYQIEKLKENKNYQIKIDNKSFDFFVNNVFIEYHPINIFYKPNETSNSYYKKRRYILNKNGYMDNPLMVIQ